MFFIFLVPYSVFAQYNGEKHWDILYGLSKNFVSREFKGYNLRFVSPPFKIETGEEYWTDEEEKNPDKFKKYRFMFELMYVSSYTDSFQVYPKPSALYHFKDVKQYFFSGNILYSIINYKRLKMEVSCGLQMFFLINPDFGLINFRRFYNYNVGLFTQLEFEIISPFIDIGLNGICTFGTKFSFEPIYSKIHRKYKLHLKKGIK